MPSTTFIQLNEGWNAEPNAPAVEIAVEGRDLVVTFLMNLHLQLQFKDGDAGRLRFSSCWRYRLGSTNDEGWYSGRCRFGKLAPNWGEFYEVGGDLLLDKSPNDWVTLEAEADTRSQLRHFLFYFRDETFECDAVDWSLELRRRPVEAEVVGLPGSQAR